MQSRPSARRKACNARQLSFAVSQALFQRLEDRRLMSVSLDSNGWTVVGASSDTQKIYVSNSTGDDGNDGSISSPVKSISKAKSMMRDGKPDWMLLKAGDTWTNETFGSWTKSGRATDEPMLISSYGTGARPKIDTYLNNGLECVGGMVSPVRHLYLMGLEFYTSTYNGRNKTSIQGLRFQRQGSDYLVEDVKVSGYSGNIVIGNTDAPVFDFKVRRSLFLDAFQYTGHAQGLYISGSSGRITIEENVFDHNGWKYQADKTMFNHNMYINTGATDIVIKGNIVTRGSLRGTLLRSGGTVLDNFYAQNGVAVQVGNSDSVVSNNVMIEGTDLPGLPSGVGVDAAFSIQNLTVTNNVIAHDISAYTFNCSGINVNSGTNNSNVSNNIVYDWRRNLINAGTDTTASNNQFEDLDGYHVVIDHRSGAKEYSDSDYYSPKSLPFKISNLGQTFSQWQNDTSDNSSWGTIRFADPNRGPASYSASLGGGATFEAWITAVRSMSKANWDPRYTAFTMNNYVREGFQLASATSLPLVGVNATRSTTTEGSSTQGIFTFSRSGSTNDPLTVSFRLVGGAINGKDYTLVPLTVIIPAGQSTTTLNIGAINDNFGELDEVVKIELVNTADYKVDYNAAATIRIYDNNGGFHASQGTALPDEIVDGDPNPPPIDPGNTGGTGGDPKGDPGGELPGDGGSGGSHDIDPTGTGLYAEYFVDPNLNTLAFNRSDATVDFNWGTGSPDAALPVNEFSIRWSGQIQPQFTENYYFYLNADDGVRLWVDGELVIDAWNHSDLHSDSNVDGIVDSADFSALMNGYGMTSGATKQLGDFNRDRKVNTVDFNTLAAEFGQTAIFGLQEFDGGITLEAGARYDIKIEYWESTQNASIQLQWEAASLARETVPMERLYPAAPQASGVVSPGSVPAGDGVNRSVYMGIISSIFSSSNPIGADNQELIETVTA
jgi:hypothetical protein